MLKVLTAGKSAKLIDMQPIWNSNEIPLKLDRTP